MTYSSCASRKVNTKRVPDFQVSLSHAVQGASLSLAQSQSSSTDLFVVAAMMNSERTTVQQALLDRITPGIAKIPPAATADWFAPGTVLSEQLSPSDSRLRSEETKQIHGT